PGKKVPIAGTGCPGPTTVIRIRRIRIRTDDRSSCTILIMFTWGITGSSLRLGGDSLRQRSLGKFTFSCAYGLFAEHRWILIGASPKRLASWVIVPVIALMPALVPSIHNC